MKNKQKNNPSHIVIVGFGDLVSKLYVPLLNKNIEEGFVSSYSVLDLESQKELVEQRIAASDCKPEYTFFLPDLRKQGVYANPADFGPILQRLASEKGRIKVVVTTEVKAHEGYLRYCVENNIDSLTEKPVLAPIKDGNFDPTAIEEVMQELVTKAEKGTARHSVMTLGRYSSIYHDQIFEPVKEKMIELQAPLTSFHLRTSSGVWNLHSEYEEREDHPYKYGYGMLMHGAYHYIDLMARFLELNKLIFPDKEFDLLVSSYAAYPQDQADRIPKKYSLQLGDIDPLWSKTKNGQFKFGETDISTTFALKRRKTGKTVTIGTLSLEQTTPSIRSWTPESASESEHFDTVN